MVKQYKRGQQFQSRSLPKTEGELQLEQTEGVQLREWYTRAGQIYAQSWQMAQSEDVQKVVIKAVGMGDYSGRFACYSQPFLDAGYAVVSYDHPGHGRSDGTHGLIMSFDDLIETLHAVVLDVQLAFPNASLYLMGASMGGLIVPVYTVRHPEVKVNAISLICPLIKVHGESDPSFILKQVAKVIKRIAPSMPIAESVEENVHTDPAVSGNFVQDPGTYSGDVRVATGLSLMDGMAEVQKCAPQMSVPMFIAHGLNDKVTDANASQDFHGKCSSLPAEKKKIVLYENGNHALWIGPGDSCFHDALQWFNEH
ncbi:hypothetical protein MIR68_011443 [Amoeboaphelidium protococcarum]|nr:hypothetical protein MIR68_011443 [Amoeboaphelidium protococcarum]